MTKEELELQGTEYKNSKNLWIWYKNDEEQLKIRESFVKHFTLDELKTMSIDEYTERKERVKWVNINL